MNSSREACQIALDDRESELARLEMPLERATIALGSAKKNAEVQRMFDLPPADRELHPALFP